jgi:hypothetical protein
MRVRTVTYFVQLDVEDFESGCELLAEKLTAAKAILDLSEAKLVGLGYEVQTKRVTFNSFENWLDVEAGLNIEEADSGNALVLHNLDMNLQRIGLDFCSIGEARSDAGIKMAPHILHFSKRFNCSVCIDSNNNSSKDVPIGERKVCPDQRKCMLAAEAMKEVHRLDGDMGNFRFTVSFDCDGRTPFFPASFFNPKAAADAVRRSNAATKYRDNNGGNGNDDGAGAAGGQASNDSESYAFVYSEAGPPTTSTSTSSSSSNDSSKGRDLQAFRGLSVGLENGDLLFLSCFGADSCDEARDNLRATIEQVAAPINSAMLELCASHTSSSSSSAAADGDGAGGNKRNRNSSNRLGLEWFGLDCSLNPGLSPVDSVASGLESILFLDTLSGGAASGGSDRRKNRRQNDEGKDIAEGVKAMMAPSKTRDALGGFDVKFGQWGTYTCYTIVLPSFFSCS